MATTLASVKLMHTNSNTTAPQVSFTIYEGTSTGSKMTVDYKIQYYSRTAASTSVRKDYEFRIGGVLVAGGSFDINGKTGTHLIKSGSYTINKTTSQQSLTVLCGFTFNLTWSGVYTGTRSDTTTLSVPVLTRYAITYNVNGGTGTVATQWKYKDETLILTSTKPTRSGYTFLGWSTSSTATSATYQSGASYTGNTGVTLYAVWKANTYTVKYNANGGTGAPSAQTKTHGTTLKLSSTKPTRDNYTFLGWATSVNGVVVYQPGDNYTTNAAVTLYAKWELSYLPPLILNAHVDWVAAESSGENLLTNSAGPFVSGTDSSYGYQSILPNTVFPDGYYTYFDVGKIYTLTFDWSVNWGSKAPVTDVRVRIGSGEDSGFDSYENDVASMIIPNLSTATSGSVSFTFTFTSTYTPTSGMAIHPIYHSSKDALDGTTWTISNVKLVEGAAGESDSTIESLSVVFDWETTKAAPTGNLAFYDASGSEVHAVSLGSLSGTSGHFERAILDLASLSVDTSYTVQITLTDSGGRSTATVTLAGTAYIMDILEGGKGIAFGKAAETENLADFAYIVKFAGGIQNIVLLKNNNLNEVTIPNTYVSKNQGASSYSNCPITSGTFVLEVMSAGAEGQVFQRLTSTFKNGLHEVYVRHYYQSAWGSWVRVYGGDTGWRSMTLQSGISVGGENGFLNARVKDGVLYINGDVKGVSTNWKGLATFPDNMFDKVLLSSKRRFVGVYDITGICALVITPTADGKSGTLSATYAPTGLTWDATKTINISVAIAL